MLTAFLELLFPYYYWFFTFSQNLTWIEKQRIYTLVTSEKGNLCCLLKVKVKSLSCVWLCDPVDYSLPGSSIHGIFQARVLEWVVFWVYLKSTAAAAAAAAATAKSLQSCLTLCNPIDSSPLGCPIPGILQARTLEWVAISFSNAWKWKVKVKLLSRVQLLATSWPATYQAPPSLGFSRQEYWSGLPLPSLKKHC